MYRTLEKILEFAAKGIKWGLGIFAGFLGGAGAWLIFTARGIRQAGMDPLAVLQISICVLGAAIAFGLATLIALLLIKAHAMHKTARLGLEAAGELTTAGQSLVRTWKARRAGGTSETANRPDPLPPPSA